MGQTEELEQREKETKELFGKKLACLRKHYHYTQEQLAEKMEVSRQLISGWESGRNVPSKDNIKVLCRLYGISESNLEMMEIDAETGEWIKQKTVKHTTQKETKSWMETGEKNEKIRKLSLQIALAAVAMSCIMMPFLGIVVCIWISILSRRWEVNHIWLDALLFVCLLVDFYFVYVFLNHTVFDYGYSTVTPL